MEKILDRFLRYVAVDTKSDPCSESQPSAAKELDLLKMLCDELNAMGVEATLDEYGYVMGTIPSNCGKDVPAIGFIALGLVLWFWYPLHKKQVEENVEKIKKGICLI